MSCKEDKEMLQRDRGNKLCIVTVVFCTKFRLLRVKFVRMLLQRDTH